MFTLKRISTSDKGTFGVLLEGAIPLCVTCEDPWNDNHKGDSCIPAGKYHCVPHNSANHPNTWEITNVPNRTAILIHSGNSIADTQGCVLAGSEFGLVNDMPIVAESKKAMGLLRTKLPPSFDLEIINDW